MLYSGTLNKREYAQELTFRLADNIPEEKERLILRCLKAVESYTEEDEQPKTESATEIAKLQGKHGKLLGLYMASHRRILHELHVKKRAPTVRALYENSETGETLVAAAAGDDILDAHVLHMVLIDYVYVCTKYNLLTCTEGRALHRWAAKKLYIAPTTVMLVHRTLERLLQEADAEPTADLGAIITADARALYEEERETAARASGKRVHGANSTNGGDGGGDGERAWNVTAGDNALLVPWPKRGVCWWHTNGKPCEDLDGTGTCRFANNHDKMCGLRYKENDGTIKICKGKHTAVQCPHKSKRAPALSQ